MGNGNGNGWIEVKPQGRRLQPIGHRGTDLCHRHHPRTSHAPDACHHRRRSDQTLIAHFGLGDAAQVDLLRIEWPSGIVQEISNVTGGRLLTVTEHQDGPTNAPSLAMSSLTDTTVQLTATGQANLRYVFEGSADLAKWTKLAVRTNLTGTVDYTPSTVASSQRDYRVVVP